MLVGDTHIDLSEFVGVPWVGGGRTLEEGFDCWGLLFSLYSRVGVELPMFGRTADPWELEALLTKHRDDDWVQVAAQTDDGAPRWTAASGGPRPLDVVEMRFLVPNIDPALQVSAHVGVLTTSRFPNRLLTTLSDAHRTDGSGGSFLTEYNTKWQQRTKAIYRHPALA